MNYEMMEILQEGLPQLPIWVNYDGYARKFDVVSSLDTLMLSAYDDDTFLVQQVQVEKLDDVRADYYLFFKIIISDGISINRDEYYAIRTPFFDNHSYEKEKERQQKIKPCKVGYAFIKDAYEKGYTSDIVNALNNTDTEKKFYLADTLWREGVRIEHINFFAEAKIDESIIDKVYNFISSYGYFNSKITLNRSDLVYIVNGQGTIAERCKRIKEIARKFDDEIDALDE